MATTCILVGGYGMIFVAISLLSRWQEWRWNKRRSAHPAFRLTESESKAWSIPAEQYWPAG